MPKTEAPAKIPPLLLRAKDAAAACGLSVSTFYQLMAQGKTPPSLKLGRARLWRRDLLEKWVQLDCPATDRFAALMAEEGANAN